MVALCSIKLSSSRLEPLAYKIFALLPATSCIPFKTEIDFENTAATLQVPVIFSVASASGPITAIVPLFFNGNTLPLFFNKTKLSAAMALASLRLPSVKISVFARFSSQ